ncbi:hypothetical protein pb186bvf_008090 [Paramecium bursaria]
MDNDTPLLEAQITSKEDNYPYWMREFIQKQDAMSKRLSQVSQQMQIVQDGLQILDQKEDEYYKIRNKKVEMPKQPQIVGNYHHYYQNQNYMRNSQLNCMKLNHYIMGMIQLYNEDPIKTNLTLSRVCKQWNSQCSMEHIWQNLLIYFLGSQFLELNKNIDYRETTLQFYKEYLHMKNYQVYFTQLIAIDCLRALKFLQQVFSIPWDCVLKQKMIEFTKNNHFKSSIEFLVTLENDILRRDAQECYVTLYSTAKFMQKRVPISNIELSTKKRINEENKNNIQLPAKIYYELCLYKVSRNYKIRSIMKDEIKLNKLEKNIKDGFITLYYGNNFIETYVSLIYNEGDLTGFGRISQNQVMNFHGNISVFIAYTTNQEESVDNYGIGQITIKIDTIEMKFQSYLCQDSNVVKIL